MRKNICGAVLLLMAFFATSQAVHAGPLDRFEGRWAGWGRVLLDTGKSESMKCVAVYRIKNGGNSAEQSFRCTSNSYRFSAKTNYKVSGGKVTATWVETIYSLAGTIAGTMTGTGLQGTIKSDTFAGRINISHSGRCRQTTKISLRRLEIRSLNVDLKRC